MEFGINFDGLQIIEKIQELEQTLDQHVQTHQEKESLMEEVINGQVKQLEALSQSLNKRVEAFGEEHDDYDKSDTASITSESLNPCSRARVQSEPWGQKKKVPEEKVLVSFDEEENDCESDQSFKTASDEL